jgi:hypothetical protein
VEVSRHAVEVVHRFRGMLSGPVDSGLPPINEIREQLGLRRVGSMDEFWRRAPLMLVASAKPFEYPHANYGDAVQMIGPCLLDPGSDVAPDWLASIDQPIVLVTTSSEKQGDDHLVETRQPPSRTRPCTWLRPFRQANRKRFRQRPIRRFAGLFRMGPCWTVQCAR